MSLEARQALVNHPHTFFNAQSQRDDLLDPSKTQTGLIALLTDLVNKGFIIQFTAIKSDHHDDSGLGLHCHFNGYCADCWPLKSAKAGDFMDPSDEEFEDFCHTIGFDQYDHQIGLAGSADTHANCVAAGAGVFNDGGADHIHIGSN